MYPNEFNPELYQEKYRIKSLRLPHWDYSSDGWYFITICTKNMVECFGEVRNFIMGLSDAGCIATKLWQEIPKHFDNVRLDEWVVMPNHLHGIIQIYNPPSVETRHGASLRWNENKFGPLPPKSLQSIINHFKGAVTNWCRNNGHQNFTWQPLFYDHIIRNEKSLNRIRKYIYDNPEKWELDRNNPDGLWM